MCEKEIKKYQALNGLAEKNGIVIFGGTDDKEIPMCELKQAFSINAPLYNRSITGLTADEAEKAFDSCVAPLCPERVLLHIGADDLKQFEENPQAFDDNYRKLINKIRESDKKCGIIIVSLKNNDNSQVISEMNRHLKHIAESERCYFGDIENKRVWNPKETKEVVSFIYSIGLPMQNKRHDYDLVKILFCYEN